MCSYAPPSNQPLTKTTCCIVSNCGFRPIFEGEPQLKYQNADLYSYFWRKNHACIQEVTIRHKFDLHNKSTEIKRRVYQRYINYTTNMIRKQQIDVLLISH